MTYCSYADILAVTGTDLLQATVETFIGLADNEVDGLLSDNLCSGSSGSNLLQNASIALTLKWMCIRGRMDRSMIAGLSIGDLSMSDNPDAAIKMLQENAERAVAQYAAKTLGPSTTDAELSSTLIRQDHEMPEFNLDQSTIVEYHDRADETGNQSTGEEV